MKLSKNNFLSLFIFLSFFACTTNDDSNGLVLNPLDYYENLNISYGNNINQKFDLYLPANRTLNTKVMVLVHGGGWSSGNKSDMNYIKAFLRLQIPNIAIVNMNYRLANENTQPYPMQIEDITSVVEYLKNNQTNYVISNDIGFIGVSAGAHLSMLWSYAFDNENKVDMVCSIVGPTNFTDPAYLNTTDETIQELIALFGINPTTDYLEEISPYHQAKSTSPPTVLFYGGQDPLIPTTQGTALRDKLQQLNVTHEFTLYPEEGHGWIGENQIDTQTKLKSFIETYM